ncbi:hypothetical protein SAMN05660916_02355 [Arthrobacter sp. 31Cvi3.1E]|nr:hypothetical protein SAMN05660916_02355 [Arthrobacter sp. 31Cvi3.1E]
MGILVDLRSLGATDVQERINAAVETARRAATENRDGGILITRHDFDHYSVAVSADVPYGWIHENDLVTRKGQAATDG